MLSSIVRIHITLGRMSHSVPNNYEIFMEWQRRAQMYKSRLRATKKIAKGTAICGCVVMLAALVFEEGWTVPGAGTAALVTLTGLLALYANFLEIRELLKCPRCKSTLQLSELERAVGKLDIAVCRHCKSTSSRSMQPNNALNADAPRAARGLAER